VRRLAFLILAALPLAAQIDPSLLTLMKKELRPSTQSFSFAAIGDQQYGEDGERKWPALVESINAAKGLRFTVHVGDIKSGSSRCSDELFADRLRGFSAFMRPMILTPGDNDWTDCHRPADGGYDPLERLAQVRKVFFSTDESFGKKKLRVIQQTAPYRENAAWAQGSVLFVTLHIIGSNNNLGRNAANDAEYSARNRATIEWMRAAFTVAKENKFGSVALVFQADPLFPLLASGPAETTAGFKDSLRAMEEESISFGKPVLAIHGDSHFFRFDLPLVRSSDKRLIDNFFRLEVPGETEVHWVRVDVDPKSPTSPFRIQHITVAKNTNR